MKQYKIIPNYEECLKICEENEQFSHSVQTLDEKEVHSFKYNLSMSDMWEKNDAMDGRLNMRGIVFIDEELVALPFPKFFNLEEVKYTKNLDMSQIKIAFEKIDGSLMSFFFCDGKIYCKSMKSVESDVSKEANLKLDSFPNIIKHAKSKLKQGLSPMYEYISPTCKIVIDYKKTDFYYLGSRNLKTGEIIYPTIVDEEFVNIPRMFYEQDEIDSYLKEPNVEGVVVTLEDGQMVKLKTEEYCRIHRIISNFSNKRILESICDKTFDDLIGQLKTNNLDSYIELAKEINTKFWDEYKIIDLRICKLLYELQGNPRKEIAIEMNKQEIESHVKTSIFKKLDNKPYEDIVCKHLKEVLK